MIPPMLLTPIAKYVGIGLFFASIWGWGYLTGRSHVTQAWDASIARQAQESALQVIAEARMTNEVLKDHAEAERKIETQIKVIEKEVVHYVTTTTNVCPLDAGFVRLYDDIRGVLDTDADGLPAPDASTREPDESSDPQATAADILPALTEFVAQVKALLIDYRHLVQWERGRYIVQRTQQGIPPDEGTP